MSSMDKNVKQMYIECGCIPKRLLIDIDSFFEYAEQNLAEKAFKQLSLDQIDMFYKLDELYKQSSATEKQAERYHNQVLLSLVPSEESKKLQDIKNFLLKCECPYTSGTNYRHPGTFHNFESLTAFFKNLGMKIE